MQFGNTDLKVKQLEEEVKSLKTRLEEKNQQYLKIWERDFHFGTLIDEVLENPQIQHALKVLNIMKQGLNNPDDFKPPTVNKEEVDKLTKEIENLRISSQDYEKKLKDIQDLYNAKIKDLEIKIQDLETKNKELDMHAANLEATCDKNKKELDDTKSYYEKKMTELVYKNDKLNEEKEFRKFQLKKHEENTKLVNKENDKENQSQDRIQKLLIELARLEGKLLNKDKELKLVWEKVEFYRNQLNK